MIILAIIATINIVFNIAIAYLHDKRISDLEELFWDNFGKEIIYEN